MGIADTCCYTEVTFGVCAFKFSRETLTFTTGEKNIRVKKSEIIEIPRGNETDIDEFEYRKPAECRVSVVDIMQVVCLSATDETVVVK